MTIYQSTAYRVRQLFSTLAAVTSSNPVLLEGERWHEKSSSTGRFTGRTKTGDGVVTGGGTTIAGTAFNNLPFDPSTGGASLSDATPQALGTAAAGIGTEASRNDHRHAMPTAGQVGADATGTAAAAVAAAAGNYATAAQGTDSREWSAATATQAEAEAGTSTTRLAFTPLRVFQAVAAWWVASAAKTKLDGIATGATANQTDAYLLSRANHTGTQAAATITGLATVATSGSASDLGTGTLPVARIPATAVTAGAYTYGSFTVDAAGRLTAASSGTAPVTSVTGTAPISSSGGTTPAISISAATTSAAGSMSSVDKTKLDGVASGATANATDAQLRDRGTHTGTQAFSTLTGAPFELGIACSDETSNLTTGTAKVTFRMPLAMTLTAVRLNVNTAPTGSALVVNIKEAGTTIFSTKPQIDATGKTSVGSSTPAVISDSSLASDAEITIDIDQIGSTIAGKGLKVWLIGTRA